MNPALAADLLLDTHIVIWMGNDPGRIPIPILEAIKAAKRCFVSHITALEIQMKNRKYPKIFGFSIESYEEGMKEFLFQELPLSYQDIKALGDMEFLHRDPFDQLLMAQASTRSLPIVTQDSDIVRTAKRFKAFQVLAG